MMPTIENLVSADRWSDVADIVNRRFETSIKASQLAKVAEENKASKKLPGWPDSTWFIWFKNRLQEISTLPTSGMPYREVRLCCELNVGFTQIEETQAMKARLPEGKAREAQEARTKLTRDCADFVRPIDRVAERVV